MADLTMDKLVALCKNRGLIFAGSELYGGLANTWDYGPLGVEFKNNVKKAWWQKFVQESKYNVGLDCAILMNREVWVASAGRTLSWRSTLPSTTSSARSAARRISPASASST